MNSQIDRFGPSLRLATDDVPSSVPSVLHLCPASMFSGEATNAFGAVATMYAVAWEAARRQVLRDAAIERIARSN